MVRLLFVFISCWYLQACTQVDNYMLGKDNTPKPTQLADIKPKVQLNTVWATPVSKKAKSHTYLKLKPVIRGHVIYIADANGMVQAVEKRNGHVLWSNQVNHALVSGPTVADGRVVVGTDSSTVVLINQATGQTIWQAHVSEDVLSKSIISHHKVIAKTIDGNLYAFDINSGKKVWMSEHGSPSLILRASSSPVSMGDLVLVGFSDGKLDAIDMNNGRMLWQRSMAYATGASDVERLVDIDADPIVRDNVIYLASYQGYIGALALDNGQFIWNKPGSVYKNIALAADTLYVTDSSDVLWAFDRQTGHVKWKQVSLKARGLTEPVLMGKYLILGDKIGYVHVISTQNGELIGRKQLKAAIDISPAVAGNMVYIESADGVLNAIKMK